MIKVKINKVVILSVLFYLPGICYTKPTAIKNSINDILLNMNRNADPCDNFYEFACGNWKPEAIYTKREKYSQLKSLTNQVFATISDFMDNKNMDLEDLYQNQLEPLRKYYKVCLESNDKHTKKSSYYLDAINKIGGFPALDLQWNEKNFDWVAMASHLNTFGCKNLLSEIVVPSYPFPFQFYKMDIGVGVALTDKASNHTTTTAYQVNSEEMLKILEMYGVDNESSQLIVKDILEFLKQIVKYNSIFDSNIESISDLFSFTTHNNSTDEIYEQVLRKYMKIAWNIDEDNSFSEILDSETDNNKLFIVKLVRHINSTKQETVANYLSIKFLHYLHGDQDLIKNNHERFCTKQIIEANGYFTSLLYNSTIPEKEQSAKFDDISKLLKEVLISLENKISNADWLDKETIDQAILKIKNVRTYVGQINGGHLGELILNETKKLKFSEVYEENLLQILKFKNNLVHLPYKQKHVISNTTKTMELLNSAQVNAFYFVLDNSVYIANGILNPPVYNREQVEAVKYGRMGYILAHEVSHAFDTIGRLFDANGDVKNWWSIKSEKDYRDKSTCFKEDLNKILIKDLDDYMQGNITVDENMADVIGISIAFDSFLRNVEDEDKYQIFTNNNLTKEQIFFISFAQLYCVEYSQNKLLNEIEDEHPTDNVRAEAALKHLFMFSDNFKCPEGSRMNLSKKCRMF